MTPSRFSKITFGITILFVCAAIPAFAQRGGGSGGGGFHGGGGAFRGGGFQANGGSRAGGFRSGPSSSARMGAGDSRSMAGMSPRFGPQSSMRPGGNVYRSYGRSAAEAPRQGYSSARAFADGQWHSFGGSAAGRESVRPFSGARPAVGTGWQTFGGARSVGETRSTRSFSGQGHNIWENAPMARNLGSSSRTLSNNRGTFNRFGPFRDNPRFGSRFGFRGGFRQGCWNCGFGWGFGFGWWPSWGWGWPWLGYWDWGPAWIDPVWGWPGYGYNYNGYPAGYTTDEPYDDNYSYSTPPESDPATDAGTPPMDQSFTTFDSNQEIATPVLLYMKDGSVYSASGYKIEGGSLRYVLTSGDANAVNLDQVDIQRTVDENAKRGARVTLKPPQGRSAVPLVTPPQNAPAANAQNSVI